MSRRSRAPAITLDDQVEGTATTSELEPEASPTSPLVPEHATPLPPGCPPPAIVTEPAPALCCGEDPPEVPRSLTAAIELPLGPRSTGYGSKQTHLDVKLRGPAAGFVDRLKRGLNAQDARLADGKHVRSAGDAIRWLIDQYILALADQTS